MSTSDMAKDYYGKNNQKAEPRTTHTQKKTKKKDKKPAFTRVPLSSWKLPAREYFTHTLWKFRTPTDYLPFISFFSLPNRSNYSGGLYPQGLNGES